MKTKIAIVMLLCATSVLVAGCGSRINANPTVDKVDIVYFDIEKDTTETMRQCSTNNEMISTPAEVNE